MGVHSTFFVPGHLDLWPWHSNLPEKGTKHVFGVNLVQIHSAVPKIFDLRTKKVTDSPKDRTLRSLLHAVKIQLKVFITWLHLTLMKHLSQHIVQITETAKRHQLSTHYNSTLYQHITSKTLTKTYIGTSHNSKHTHTHTEFQIYTHSDQATSLHTFITLTPLTLCKTAAENKPVSNTFRNVHICVYLGYSHRPQRHAYMHSLASDSQLLPLTTSTQPLNAFQCLWFACNNGHYINLYSGV